MSLLSLDSKTAQSQQTFTVNIVSLPINFSILLNQNVIQRLKIPENGSALVKGVNDQIALVKAIPDPDCPPEEIRLPPSVQFTLSASNGDKIPILPFELETMCEAVQIAPLFDEMGDDWLRQVSDYFAQAIRPISVDSIFIIRVGNNTRAFKILRCLPADRCFADKNTKVYPAEQPGPVLPLPPIPRNFADLAFDEKVIDCVKNYLYIPIYHKDLFQALKLRNSSGLFIYGPSGCGKTALMSAIASSLEVPTIYLDMYRIMQLSLEGIIEKLNQCFHYPQGKRSALLLIDGIHNLAKPLAQVRFLNEKRLIALFMKLLDQALALPNVLVVATANIKESIEPALLRQGRFDYVIELPLPSTELRTKLIKLNTRGMQIEEMDMERISSKLTEGMTGLELEELCRTGVISMIEEVTGSNGSSVTDELAVYSLNTKLRPENFGFPSEDDAEKRRRRKRHRSGLQEENDIEPAQRSHKRRRKPNQFEDDNQYQSPAPHYAMDDSYQAPHRHARPMDDGRSQTFMIPRNQLQQSGFGFPGQQQPDQTMRKRHHRHHQDY